MAWRRAAACDATHPTTFFAIFAAGLTVNIAAMVESVIRFRKNPDPLERRRVALSVWTLALGTFAFTVSDGVPAVVAALGGRAVRLAGLDRTSAAPARRPSRDWRDLRRGRASRPLAACRRAQSLQYALARKTLGCRRVLPAILLVVSLVRKRDQSLAAIVAGQPLIYAVLLACS